MDNLFVLEQEWLRKEKLHIEPQAGRTKKRQYLHFDKRISELNPDLLKKIWSKGTVASHSFYPFLRLVKSVKLYKRIPGTRKRGLFSKKRPIDYAAHTDALIFSWYAFILSFLYEQKVRELGVSANAIAYRKLDGKNNIDFAKEVFDFIDAHPGFVAVAFDVEKFFENLDHRLLKNLWKDLLKVEELPPDHYAVFRAVTAFRYADITQMRKTFNFSKKEQGKRDRVCSTREFREKVCDGGLLMKNPRTNQKTGKPVGIPQGSPISCVFSNIYMLPFDVVVAEAIEKVGGLYRRYSDDIIIVVPKEETDCCEAMILGEIEKIGLNINSSKTEKVKFVKDEHKQVARAWADNAVAKLQYLGVEFDGEHMRLRHGGLARFQRRRVRAVRRFAKWAEDKKRPIPKETLINKFTRKGEHNYLSYADRAIQTLASKAIHKQTSEQKFVGQLKKLLPVSKTKK